MNPPIASCTPPAARLSRVAFRLLSATVLALVFHPAMAQDTAALPTVTVVGKAPRGIDTPTSTGSNLDITPLQTPASVEVVTQEQLRARGDASLIDAITRAAGISSLAHPGNSGSALSVRGFIDASSVMRLYDGTRQYGGVGVSFPFDTWSVERIEVLRGPASVIHGEGAIGGVVNVVPKKPQRGPVRNEVQAVVGTDGQRALAFDSTGALSEALSYRVGVSADRSDGWVDRGDSRNLSFSGALRLDASPDLSVTLSHAQGEQHPMRYFGIPLIEGRQLVALRERNYNVADGEIAYRDRWTELAARWMPSSDITVRSKVYGIQSNRHWRNVEAYEYDPSARLIDRSDSTEIAHDQTQLGNTIDAVFKGSLFGRPNQVSVGFDVNTSSFTHTNNTYTGDATSVDPFAPVPGLYSSAIPFIPRYRNKAEQVAVFLEDRLELTPRWSVVAGLRHDRADVSRRDLVTGTQAFATRYSNTGWRLGTVFQLQPTLSLDAHRPLFRVQLHDAASTVVYVSSATGEVVLDAPLAQRGWNFVGAWLHWLYMVREGSRDEVWSWTVIALSAAGTLLAVSGAVAGLWRWRFSGRYKSGARTPYRDAAMRWHHIVGLLFGGVMITWVFSGLMSMNPLGIFDPGHGRPDIAAYREGLPGAVRPSLSTAQALALLQREGFHARELAWRVLAGQAYLLARDGTDATRLVVPTQAGGHAVLERWPHEVLEVAGARLFEAPIESAQWLDAHDAFYVQRGEASMYAAAERRLPVLRLRFGDAGETLAYLDPYTGDMALSLDRSQRTGRWLFNLLHSWDLPVLLRFPVGRDLALTLLSIGAGAIALTGCIVGYRRLRLHIQSGRRRRHLSPARPHIQPSEFP